MAIVWNNWRDNLKDASFRDIPFKVLSHTAEGGRRTQLHQFPFNDEPYLEDFGKDAGVYRVEAYICQSSENAFDYFPLRDLLREALESEGPGTLVHPFLGTLNVGVQGKYQLKESFGEGGIARFTITFVEAGKAQQTSTTPPLDPGLDDKQTSIWDCIGEGINIANNIGYVVNSALQQVQYYADAVTGVLLMPVTIAGSVLSAAITTVATLKSNISAVINIPNQLAATMAQFGEVFKSLTELLPDSSTQPITGTNSSWQPTDTSFVDAILKLSTFGSDFVVITATTPDRQIQADNQALIIDAVRASAMVEATRTAAALNYTSYNDAVAMRKTLVDAFDYVLSGISSGSKNDELYTIVEDVKQYILELMVSKGANLPVLKEVDVLADSIPSLAFAQSLYGDINREAEIIARNPAVMRHPGFPAGGRKLVTLSE